MNAGWSRHLWVVSPRDKGGESKRATNAAFCIRCQATLLQTTCLRSLKASTIVDPQGPAAAPFTVLAATESRYMPKSRVTSRHSRFTTTSCECRSWLCRWIHCKTWELCSTAGKAGHKILQVAAATSCHTCSTFPRSRHSIDFPSEGLVLALYRIRQRVVI